MRALALVICFAGLRAGTGPSVAWGAGVLVQAPSPRRPARYTPQERHDAGQKILGQLIAAHGAVENQAWQERVTEILSRLRRAAAYPELELGFVIVGTDEVNAGAIPGGYIAINAGMLRVVDSLGTAEAEGDPARARLRADAYLAAVLGHELAHITLRHTDEIIDRMRQALAPSERARAPRDPTVYETELRLKPDLVRAARHDQATELAADSLGALYLLRAGWEIQDALDLLRHWEAMERQTSGLGQFSYARDHPRSSAREAMLEQLRGRLKLNQGRLDDALILINTNAELDLAIALLDSVITDFPTLLAARHARATAYHRKWLNGVPVQVQAVRSSLFAYSSYFLPSIRGLGDTTWLVRARNDYQAVLAVDSLPGTLANLATLDAYSGHLGLAHERAERAVALAPSDPQVHNDLGVVRFLARDLRGAEAEFEQALGEQGAEEDPAVVFNLGKTQALLDDPKAHATLEAYVQLDQRSAWSLAAKQLLGTTAEEPAPVAAPPPPGVAGISLGVTGDSILRLWGKPDSIETRSRGAVWRYPAKGITLFVTPGEGVAVLELDRPEGGSIEGVRVGDPVQAARGQWGWPTARQEGLLLYTRAGWMIGVGYGDPNGKILRLELGTL